MLLSVDASKSPGLSPSRAASEQPLPPHTTPLAGLSPEQELLLMSKPGGLLSSWNMIALSFC